MDDQPIRVVCADDHAFIRDGIAYVLEKEPGIDLVGEATNGLEAVAAYKSLRPDVTLLDMKMPQMNGIEALTAIRQFHAHAKVIVLTTYAGDVHAARALKVGAAGYLLKNTLRTDLVSVIRSIHAGGHHVPVDVAASIAANLATEQLSARELEVLRAIAEGVSNKAAGNQLNISEDTVKGHMRSLMAKLGANDRTHAILIALKRGILDES